MKMFNLRTNKISIYFNNAIVLIFFFEIILWLCRHHVGIIEKLGKKHKIARIDEETEFVLFITHRASIS